MNHQNLRQKLIIMMKNNLAKIIILGIQNAGKTTISLDNLFSITSLFIFKTPNIII